MRALTRIALIGAMLALGACPSRTRRVLTPDAPKTGDPDARARYEDAQRTFKRDSTKASSKFESIARDFPNDPIANHARLYAGIAAVRARDLDKAVTNLRKLVESKEADSRLRKRGQLYLGLALNYRGEHAQARDLLGKGEKAIADDAERLEWLAAMAESHSHSTKPLQALSYYDRWFDKARASERAFILARLRAVVGAASALDARQAYTGLSSKSGPSAAVLGLRLASDYMSAGDSDRAAKVRKETAAARRSAGIATPRVDNSKLDGSLIGAILPLSGRRARVGDLAMRGLVMASGALGGKTGVQVALRDSASQSSQAVASTRALAAAGAMAVIGPIDRGSARAVAAQADSLGVPLITLAQRPLGTATGSHVFHVVHSAEERARALARYAYKLGKRDFAMLSPRSGYGRVVGKAFREEVKRLGGTMVVEASYDSSATSFGSTIRSLKKPWQVLFIPDQAARLRLIAPALAAANLRSMPQDAKKPRHGRKILLLSTAEFVTPAYLRSAGRYSEGAVFAPGFYPDRFDKHIAAFVDAYEAAFKRSPTVFDAYAYDAAQAVRAALAAGAATRQAVAAALTTSKTTGVTGSVSFGKDRRRADDGLLFVVTRRSTGDWALRAQRK
jgi:ABC-type branched-subunit amino acid transport system substrate-binding protein